MKQTIKKERFREIHKQVVKLLNEANEILYDEMISKAKRIEVSTLEHNVLGFPKGTPCKIMHYDILIPGNIVEKTQKIPKWRYIEIGGVKINGIRNIKRTEEDVERLISKYFNKEEVNIISKKSIYIKMKQTINNVEQWFADRQIIENSTPLKQALKTSEEVLELQHAILDNNWQEIIDAIGDIQVTLIGVCLHQNIDYFKEIVLGDPNEEPVDEDTINYIKKNVYVSSFNLDFWAGLLKEEIYKRGLSADVHHTLMMFIRELSIIAELNNVTVEQCLKSAYDVISKRTGKMINGQFVKD